LLRLGHAYGKGARTAGCYPYVGDACSADPKLAGAVQRAPALDPKPDSFSAAPKQ